MIQVNATTKLPPKLFDARCWACWLMFGVLLLVIASFASLNLQWAQFFSWNAVTRMGRFVAELMHPEVSAFFLNKVLTATMETLAMSVLGTLLALILGLVLALPASKSYPQDSARWRGPKPTAIKSKAAHTNSGVLRRAFSNKRLGPRQRAGSCG